jgi:hypothetical protein
VQVCLERSASGDDDTIADTYSCCSKTPSTLFEILPGVSAALPAHLNSDEYSVQRYLTTVYSFSALGFAALLLVAYSAGYVYRMLRFLLTGYHKNVEHAECRPGE